MLRLDRRLEVAGEYAPRSGSAGELVHQEDAVVLDYVVLVLGKHYARLYAGAYLCQQPGALLAVNIAVKDGFRLVRALVGEIYVSAVLVDPVVLPGESADLCVHIGGGAVVLHVDIPGDDKRNTRFVYHYAVGFVHDGEIQLVREHHLVRGIAHKIPQVVESCLPGGEIHHLAAVNIPALFPGRIRCHAADGYAHLVIDGLHPLIVALCKIVVESQYHHLTAGERFVARCEHSGESLSLASLHLHHIMPGKRQRRAQLLRIGSDPESFPDGAVHPGKHLVHSVPLRSAGLRQALYLCNILRIQKRSPYLTWSARSSSHAGQS